MLLDQKLYFFFGIPFKLFPSYEIIIYHFKLNGAQTFLFMFFLSLCIYSNSLYSRNSVFIFISLCFDLIYIICIAYNKCKIQFQTYLEFINSKSLGLPKTSSLHDLSPANNSFIAAISIYQRVTQVRQKKVCLLPHLLVAFANLSLFAAAAHNSYASWPRRLVWQ